VLVQVLEQLWEQEQRPLGLVLGLVLVVELERVLEQL